MRRCYCATGPWLVRSRSHVVRNWLSHVWQFVTLTFIRPITEPHSVGPTTPKIDCNHYWQHQDICIFQAQIQETRNRSDFKSWLVKVFFEMPPERVECTGWTEWVGKRIRNSWSSCVERAGTESNVIAGTCRRLEEEDDLRTREWVEYTSVRRLEAWTWCSIELGAC